MSDHTAFHEVWWIYSPVNNKEWAGLRIAHFRKAKNGETGDDVLIVNITGEIDQRRIGPRVWDDIQQSEHWYKVEQIPVPNLIKVMAAAIDDEETVEHRKKLFPNLFSNGERK